MKIHSKDGVSYLYDILCALQYAKNRNANIINASFGYYSPKYTLPSGAVDSSAILFKSFLKNYFIKDPAQKYSILMVAAAGNLDDVNENMVYPTSDVKARRNLDSVNFFPASFAREMDNVIAVTTVSEKTNNVSPHQNFSPRVVDVGVDADFTDHDLYLFWNPRDRQRQYTVEGSSFATPIVTGKIAANYDLIEGLLGSGSIDKTLLFKALSTRSLWHPNNAFNSKIKKSRVMKIPK